VGARDLDFRELSKLARILLSAVVVENCPFTVACPPWTSKFIPPSSPLSCPNCSAGGAGAGGGWMCEAMLGELGLTQEQGDDIRSLELITQP